MKITLFFTKIRNVIYLNEAKSNSSFKINVRERHTNTPASLNVTARNPIKTQKRDSKHQSNSLEFACRFTGYCKAL